MTAGGADFVARWTESILGARPPKERHADCANCVMCRVPEPDLGGTVITFSPQTKCCTYVPRLANFLAGGLLRTTDTAYEAGRASLRARIAAGNGAGLLGVPQPSEVRDALAAAPERFGRDVSLRCPHFREEDGRCGIWGHTESTCFTWFCKHDRGSRGRHFWRSLRELLREMEDEVARWCVLRLARDELEVDQLLAARTPWNDFVTGRAATSSPRRRSAADLERFYVDCAGLADGLSFDDVVGLSGPTVALRVAVVRRLHHEVEDTALPARLRIGNYQVVAQSRAQARIVTDSELDPLDVPVRLLHALPAFDGRPVAEVVAELREHANLDVPDETIRSLVDFHVLLPEEERRG